MDEATNGEENEGRKRITDITNSKINTFKIKRNFNLDFENCMTTYKKK